MHVCNASTGEYKVQNIRPQENGEKAKVKVKIEVNTSGIVSVSSATMVLRVSSDKSETTEINEIYSHGGSDDIEIEVGFLRCRKLFACYVWCSVFLCRDNVISCRGSIKDQSV